MIPVRSKSGAKIKDMPPSHRPGNQKELVA